MSESKPIVRYFLASCAIVAFMFSMAAKLQAQDSSSLESGSLEAPNEILLEAGGRGGRCGLSYERQFSRLFGLNIGVAPFFGENLDGCMGGFFALNVHLSDAPGHLFVDAGYSYLPVPSWSFWIPSFGMGYRYRPNESAFTFKGGLLLTLVKNFGPFPWFGLAMGYSF